MTRVVGGSGGVGGDGGDGGWVCRYYVNFVCSGWHVLFEAPGRAFATAIF